MRRDLLAGGILLVGLPAAIVLINLFDREVTPAARAYFESGEIGRASCRERV